MPVYDGHGALLSPDQQPVLETLTTSPRHATVYGIDRPSDGQRKWLTVNWSLLDPTDPARSSVLVSFVDITESHNSHQQLLHQATHDLLTGLPNRARVLALMTEYIAAGHCRLGAVLFIDFDNFKAINDALGHHAGDTVLQIAAKHLDQALRPGDVVGRVGGDEFVALLAAPLQPAEIDDVARRLHAALAEPIAVDYHLDPTAPRYVWISASIGLVSVRPDDSRSAEEVLRDADLAMYQPREPVRPRAATNKTLPASHSGEWRSIDCSRADAGPPTRPVSKLGRGSRAPLHRLVRCVGCVGQIRGDRA